MLLFRKVGWCDLWLIEHGRVPSRDHTYQSLLIDSSTFSHSTMHWACLAFLPREQLTCSLAVSTEYACAATGLQGSARNSTHDVIYMYISHPLWTRDSYMFMVFKCDNWLSKKLMIKPNRGELDDRKPRTSCDTCQDHEGNISNTLFMWGLVVWTS